MVERSKLKIDLDDNILEVCMNGNIISFSIPGDFASMEMASNSMISIFFGRLIENIISGKIFQIEDDEFFTYPDGKLKMIYQERKRMNEYFKERGFGDYITVDDNIIEVKGQDGNILRLSRSIDKIVIEIVEGSLFIVPGTSRIFHAYNKYFIQLFRDLQKYKDLLGIEEINNSYCDEKEKEFKKL